MPTTYTPSQMAAAIAEIGQAALQAKGNLEITQNGDFSYTPDSGYDGLASVSGTVAVQPSPTKAAQTYTPTTTDQVIAANQWLSGAQTIKGDANLIAGNIKNGVNIFGVTGSYSDVTVETINGTFRNPWGNKNPSLLMAQADAGDLSMHILDVSATQDVYYNLKSRNANEFDLIANWDVSVAGVPLNLISILRYNRSGNFISWGSGSSLSEYNDYADDPCTLTIIHHPLPT